MADGDLIAALKLLRPDPPIELRVLDHQGRMVVQRFMSQEAAAEWAGDMDPMAKGIYLVMNPFATELLKGSAVDDAAVLCREWLLIDADPSRPKDTNASDAELNLAAATAAGIATENAGFGWPEPIHALSGNGAHLLYRINLPNDEEAKELVFRVLRSIAQRHSNDAVRVDTTVGNAARITKLYGTMTRKGASTEERPARRSQLTQVPEELKAVRLQQLIEIAELVDSQTPLFAAPPPGETAAAGGGDQSTYDLGQVLAKVTVLRSKFKDGSTFREIVCPWAHEHSSAMPDTATVITQRADTGGLGFKCLHEHCQSRNWKDLRAALGLETTAWQEGKKEKPEKPVVSAGKLEQLRGKRCSLVGEEEFAGVLAEMDHYALTGSMPRSVSTGMYRLDRKLLGGFRPGMFYVLGGESGRGKSTLLLQWAFEAARRWEPEGRTVAIVSPEMGPQSFAVRAFSMLSERPIEAYRQNPIGTKAAWVEARNGAPKNLRASFDPDDIEPLIEDENPALFIVDYAQQAVSYTETQRYTALAELGARCLRIAKERNIPVIIGSQVNVINNGADKERDFSIRETKILEHQADVVMFIDVEFARETNDEGHYEIKGTPSLRVVKHRHGPGGKVDLVWHRKIYKFEEKEFSYGQKELVVK